MPLREKVLRGGIYLSLREGIGLAAGIVGILLLTKIIGPTQYGIYRVALEVVAYFAGVARLGLDAYLVRRPDAPSRTDFNQVFSVLLVGSFCLMAMGFSALVILRAWLGDARYFPPLYVLLASLPLTVLSIPSLAMLERELDYRKVAGLETGGKLLYHSTAVLLAYFGWGFWGAVVGYILWQAWTTFGSWFLARYVPQWSWSWHSTKGMLKYGVGYSSSIWIYSLRSLVNPLLVGKYLGPEYVGYVSLTSRLVEVLGFVKAATFRLSMVVLGKVQDDLGRLRRGVEEALGLQALSMGAPLSVFALAAPTLLPSLIGPRWAPALQIYSFIALGYMLNALFGVHASVLYVRKRNREVIEAYGVYVLLFAVTAFLLIPALGIWGYGAAELIAIPAYGLLHRSVRKLFEFNYARATPWLIAFPPLLFYPNLGWPPGLALLLPALAIFFTPSARKQLSEYLSYLRPGLVDEQSNE